MAILLRNKVIFRETFARLMAEPFCHQIFSCLSRNFRPPNRGAFLSQSFAKKKMLYFRKPGSRSFREPLLKQLHGHPLVNPFQGAFHGSSSYSYGTVGSDHWSEAQTCLQCKLDARFAGPQAQTKHNASGIEGAFSALTIVASINATWIRRTDERCHSHMQFAAEISCGI